MGATMPIGEEGFNMVEPVTTAAATSTAANAAGAVADAASGAATTAGNWLTNLISAPFRAITSVPGQLFGAVGGAAKGVFGSLWNGVLFTVGLTGLKLLSPEGWRSAVTAIGGEEAAARTAEMVRRDGIGGVVLDSALQGFGLAAAVGGARGAVDGGGLLAGGGLVAGVGALAYSSLGSHAAPTTSPTTPGARSGQAPSIP